MTEVGEGSEVKCVVCVVLNMRSQLSLCKLMLSPQLVFERLMICITSAIILINPRKKFALKNQGFGWHWKSVLRIVCCCHFLQAKCMYNNRDIHPAG